MIKNTHEIQVRQGMSFSLFSSVPPRHVRKIQKEGFGRGAG